MNTHDTRQTLLQVGTNLINLHGFNATGLDAVLKTAEVPKGSFYHYFRSKEDFGLAVIDGFVERVEERLRACLEDHEVSPLERIRNFITDRMDWFVQNQSSQGCLLGNLGQEMANSNPRICARLQEAFEMWQERLTTCLLEAQVQGELRKDLGVEQAAGFILSGFQGSVLRAKLAHSPVPIQEFMDTLFATVLRP